MSNMTISIIQDFSAYPAGRYLDDGPFSGERFRDELLIPELNKMEDSQTLIINMDGARGYGSSFLEEAFGGLIRKLQPASEQFFTRIQFVANDDPSLKDEIYEYMRDAFDEPVH